MATREHAVRQAWRCSSQGQAAHASAASIARPAARSSAWIRSMGRPSNLARSAATSSAILAAAIAALTWAPSQRERPRSHTVSE